MLKGMIFSPSNHSPISLSNIIKQKMWFNTKKQVLSFTKEHRWEYLDLVLCEIKKRQLFSLNDVRYSWLYVDHCSWLYGGRRLSRYLLFIVLHVTCFLRFLSGCCSLFLIRVWLELQVRVVFFPLILVWFLTFFTFNI